MLTDCLPGWVATPMAAGALQDESIIYQALASTPLRKVATPEDIAHQILILSSSKVSGHVTGASAARLTEKVLILMMRFMLGQVLMVEGR